MRKNSASLWIAVAVVFALMACAWTAMFFFASQAKVESVPIASDEHTGAGMKK